MIQVEHISKSFGKLKVLDDVSVLFKSASFVGVAGPNGSGKTTLIKSILGLVRPDAGNIYFANKAVDKHWEYRRYISYLPQAAQFPSNLTVTELIAMLEDLRLGGDRKAELLDMFGIHQFSHKHIGALSGGMKQKVNILATLMYDSPCIILDEPTTGLDPASQLKLKAFLTRERQAGKCIILTSHILSLLDELCDELLFLMDGHVHFQGSTQKLLDLTQTTLIERAIPELMNITIPANLNIS
jgi:Cu-processing system ATP-binding protein